jgi:hypothetical protein
VAFRVSKNTCYAEKALKEYEDRQKPRGDRAAAKDKKEWGLFYTTAPFVPENVQGELPTRDEFYSELAGTVNLEHNPEE